MNSGPQPLVTIGIPTFNRAGWLRRSIDSGRGQDHASLEIIVSDNGSTDGTWAICTEYARLDPRIRCRHFERNRGATANFQEVLDLAHGKYFMWLGDDDWIDPAYVSRCVALLEHDPRVAIASGTARYYRDGKYTEDGRCFEIAQSTWEQRVLAYYRNVTDNGMFYGVMRTCVARRTRLRNEMGGDWHVIASLLTAGTARTVPDVYVHRELGGASSSPAAIARSLGLSGFQANWPTLAMAAGAVGAIVRATRDRRSASAARRTMIGLAAGAAIMAKHGRIYGTAAWRLVTGANRL